MKWRWSEGGGEMRDENTQVSCVVLKLRKVYLPPKHLNVVPPRLPSYPSYDSYDRTIDSGIMVVA